MDTLTVTVTDSDIQQWRRSWEGQGSAVRFTVPDPLAIALTRQGFARVAVDLATVMVRATETSEPVTYILPFEAQDFVYRADAGQDLAPTTFVLTLAKKRTYGRVA